MTDSPKGDLLPDDVDKSSVSFNSEIMEQLQSMGFGENRCKKALLATGNLDADAAVSWLFEHMDDPGIYSTVD